MRLHYDVIVVGAGPAGSMAALRIAREGADVLLLERKPEVGIPVRCAEGVSQSGLHEFFQPAPRWIASEIDGIVMVAPNGQSVTIQDVRHGYILNRDIFDADLAKMAEDAGATVHTNSYVVALLKNGSHAAGVRFLQNGNVFEAESKIVIGADGLESRIGRWGGIPTWFAMNDIESCLQVTMTEISISPNCIALYFGRTIAPGGYAWVFPKGEHRANIGVGISGNNAGHKAAHLFLKEFISQYFPSGRIERTIAGGVPCAQTLQRITADGLMLAGDAAHQVNPLTGGGIIRALQSGDIAGRVAARAVRRGNVSAEGLQEYVKEWHAKRGKSHAYYYKLKNVAYSLTDEHFNHIADTVSRLPEKEKTLYAIFKIALVHHPDLLKDLLKVIVWG